MYTTRPKKTSEPKKGLKLNSELRRIWQGSYDLCIKTAHLDDARARRFADATVQGVFEADQSLALAS